MKTVEAKSETMLPVATTNMALTPMDMLDRAITQGANIEVLTKLVDLQERWDKNQARKAFDEALSAAKAEIPTILKNRVVDFTSQKGRTNYRHEDLAEIARTVDPILSRHGLSYRWRTANAPNEPITVTCVVSHSLGHAEENTLTAGRDDSGNKNSIQAIGSTITYLQRYTLKAALGLAASNDDDAKGAEADGPISADQIGAIRSLIDEVAADIPRFCKFMKVERIEDITTKRYSVAVEALNAKRKSS